MSTRITTSTQPFKDYVSNNVYRIEIIELVESEMALLRVIDTESDYVALSILVPIGVLESLHHILPSQKEY